MVLSNGVTEYLKKDYKIFGDFFATCKKNYHGSYDLVRILKITSENTLEEERGVNQGDYKISTDETQTKPLLSVRVQILTQKLKENEYATSKKYS